VARKQTQQSDDLRVLIRDAAFPCSMGDTCKLKLMLYTIYNRGRCFSSLDTFAEDTGMSRATVGRVLKALSEAGIVETKYMRKTGRGASKRVNSKRAFRSINETKLSEFRMSSRSHLDETVNHEESQSHLDETMNSSSQSQIESSQSQNGSSQSHPDETLNQIRKQNKKTKESAESAGALKTPPRLPDSSTQREQIRGHCPRCESEQKLMSDGRFAQCVNCMGLINLEDAA